MDRAKALLPILKKHHFWLLLGVVFLAAFAGWWNGTGGLSEEFERARGELQDRFTSVDAIGQRPNHPNQTFITAVNDQHKTLKEEVYRAWKILFDDQQKVLVWPEGFSDVANLAPDAEIPDGMRYKFLNYFKDVFPDLFATVEPLESATSKKEGGEPMGLVAWEQNQQDAIVDAYAWSRIPSTKAIRFAQEDYWVYQALLTIIKRANKKAGSKAHHNAAVKVINNLQIAQAAVRPKTETLSYTGDAEGGSQTGAGVQNLQRPGIDAEDAELADGRYVDDQGNPLGAASTGPFAEFKLMPVLIDVFMDQRKIPFLLAECANSELPVEVRQVRINPRSGDSGGSKLASNAAGGGANQPGKTDYYVNVEIWGLIYIFERPDTTTLGIDEALAAELAAKENELASQSQVAEGGDQGQGAGDNSASGEADDTAGTTGDGTVSGSGAAN